MLPAKGSDSSDLLRLAITSQPCGGCCNVLAPYVGSNALSAVFIALIFFSFRGSRCRQAMPRCALVIGGRRALRGCRGYQPMRFYRNSHESYRYAAAGLRQRQHRAYLCAHTPSSRTPHRNLSEMSDTRKKTDGMEGTSERFYIVLRACILPVTSSLPTSRPFFIKA